MFIAMLSRTKVYRENLLIGPGLRWSPGNRCWYVTDMIRTAFYYGLKQSSDFIIGHVVILNFLLSGNDQERLLASLVVAKNGLPKPSAVAL